jgi:hypothetical protein
MKIQPAKVIYSPYAKAVSQFDGNHAASARTAALHDYYINLVAVDIIHNAIAAGMVQFN